MKELVQTVVETDQGVFTLTHTKDWKPFGSSLGVFRHSDGILTWFMYEPSGTLIKYPNGVKRFIPEHTAADLKTICEMI